MQYVSRYHPDAPKFEQEVKQALADLKAKPLPAAPPIIAAVWISCDTTPIRTFQDGAGEELQIKRYACTSGYAWIETATGAVEAAVSGSGLPKTYVSSSTTASEIKHANSEAYNAAMKSAAAGAKAMLAKWK